MSTLKILIVEDHPGWQKILSSNIKKVDKKMNGIIYLQVSATFEEAWQSLTENGPWHILITDIGLGEKPESYQKLGIRLLEFAHEHNIPCIVISGTPVLTAVDVRNILKKYEALDFLSKQEFDGEHFCDLILLTLQNMVESHRKIQQNKNYEYDLALSFAGEDRTYVEKVAKILVEADVSVFYDEYEKVRLWGKDLYEHLHEVYYTRSQYTVIFISKHYAKKLWTNHERRASQARAIEENREYILPVRFDETEVKGILPTTAYISGKNLTPQQLASMILKKLTPKTDQENDKETECL